MKKLACWLLLAVSCVAAHAAPLLDREVPAPLQAWIAWTLQGQDQRACPLRHATDVQRLCVWPSSLQLSLDESGGRFELDARLYAQDWIALPGDAEHWPQDLRVNGIPAPVALREGRPALWLGAGNQRIQGVFRWPVLPESLYVPGAAGLLDLSVNGAPRAYPARDDRGHVWLGKTAVAGATENRHLSLTVFRLIDDDIPGRLTTHIDIEAAGEVRDEVIGPVLPAGFVALEIGGSLPARLDDDGRLHVQVRPGIWNVEITARATAPLRELALPKNAPPWPEQEVWSFLAHNDLRVVETGGAPALDPRQTQMPEAWRSYPAFLLQGAGKLTLDEKQRGNPQAEADQLNLQRQLWLDFDGGGYTLQDQLNGRLNSRWRLEAAQPIAPGRVQVDGEPQLITKLADAAPGVEVRHGQLNLSADSRVDSNTRRLPVAGWNADFQSVETTLHLPPGWRLLAASGADNLPDTWIARWSLLDLFIVLIATVAALRLFGPTWGALTLFALLLSWHEPGAPRWAWLNLIAAIALARALPDSLRSGQLPTWIQRYRWVSAAAVLLIALPFAIQQVRISIYPQLERQLGGGASGAGSEAEVAQADMMQEQAVEAPVAMSAPAPAERVERKRAMRLESSVTSDSSANVSQQAIQRMDPNVLTQTGPGVPEWSWRSATLNWSGPVTAEQSFRLWLLPPWLSRLLQVLSAALIFVVLARWMELQPSRLPTGLGKRTVVLLAISAAGLLAATPQTLYAQQAVAEPQPPPQNLLDELRRRLLAAPDCAPDCVQIPRLALEVGGSEQVTLRLSIDALAPSALPLPLPLLASGAQGRIWQPAQVLLDGAPAPLLRSDDGTLSIAVPAGRHEALIRGSLAGFDQLQLPLPLKPRWIDTQLRGWLLTGVDERGQIADALQLLRSDADAGGESQAAAGESAQQALPPLLVVTRTLHLGLNWDVDTQVRRIGVTHTPVLAEIPLLAGEQITGEAVRVANGAVQLSLAPGQDSAQWSSRLPVTAALKLSASTKTDRVEIWQFDISPIWHAEFSGLPPISHQSGEYWLPRYQPWPGESLALRIVRPSGVQGQTLTLDAVELKTQPAQRATDVEANFRLRASQGGQHAIVLPEGLQLQRLSIDGQPQPARQEGGKLILPLRPGTQNVQLNLRSDAGISALLRTPLLNLGLPGVNARLQVELPQDRWVLFVGGPRLGPAVLFWGVLAVLLLVAFALARIKLTPLKFWHWALLMIGLSQLPAWGAAIVAAWLIALGLRGRYGFEAAARRFNAMQAALVALSLFALGLLFTAVAQGLLGAPDMQISGNESYGNTLLWFQDRWMTALPQAWVVSVPLWIYRVLMLAWALWLANALLGWLRWGWEQFTANGIWHRRPPKAVPAGQPPSNTQQEH